MKKKSRVFRWVFLALASLILAPVVLYVYEMNHSRGPDVGYEAVLRDLILQEDGSYEIHVELIREGRDEGKDLYVGPPEVLFLGSVEKPTKRWKRQAQLTSSRPGPVPPARAVLVYQTEPLPPDPEPFYLCFELNVSASAGGMMGFLGHQWDCLHDIQLECTPPQKEKNTSQKNR